LSRHIIGVRPAYLGDDILIVQEPFKNYFLVIVDWTKIVH